MTDCVIDFAHRCSSSLTLVLSLAGSTKALSSSFSGGGASRCRSSASVAHSDAEANTTAETVKGKGKLNGPHVPAERRGGRC